MGMLPLVTAALFLIGPPASPAWRAEGGAIREATESSAVAFTLVRPAPFPVKLLPGLLKFTALEYVPDNWPAGRMPDRFEALPAVTAAPALGA